MTMRLSTSTCIYFNRPGGGKAAIVDCIRRCAAAGYRRLDMNFHDANTSIEEFRADGQWEHWLAEIGRTAEQVSVGFGQAHLPFYNFCHPETVNAARQDELIRRAIDGCARLGIPWAVIHPGTAYGVSRPRRESMRRNLAYFRRLAGYAGEQGVGLAFENLWDLNIAPQVRFATTAEELLEFLHELDLPNTGVCWDFEHAGLMQQDQTASLQLIGSKLVATHVSDFINAEADHLLPFHGRLDWVEAMRALGSIDYHGDLAFEMHNYLARLPDDLVQDALCISVAVGELLLGYAHSATGTHSSSARAR